MLTECLPSNCVADGNGIYAQIMDIPAEKVTPKPKVLNVEDDNADEPNFCC